MESEPLRDPRVREAMEACRPAHDDLSDLGLAYLADRLESDPALAREYGRLKRLDRSLAGAFRDVSVPEGLSDRILAFLASQDEASGVPDYRAAAEPLACPATDNLSQDCQPGVPRPEDLGAGNGLGVGPRSRRLSRRWLLACAGSVVAAVALLLLVGRPVGGPPPLDGSDVDQVAIEFYGREGAEDGQPIEEVAPPKDYPFAAGVQQPPGTRWRWVRSFLGRTAVAYDITSANGARGTLYVLLAEATNVADRPASQPFVTQGCAASAWRANGCLYVFVVQGGLQTYNRLLVTPREPLA